VLLGGAAFNTVVSAILGRARRRSLGAEPHRLGRAPGPRVRHCPRRRSPCGFCASPATDRWCCWPPRW
jgi:hypothetical protein